MNAAEFQSQVIDKLDKVVVGAEALIMDENARTAADFERLKSEIRALLDIITRYERLCYGESSLSSVKQTLAALKRSTEGASSEVERGASAALANAVEGREAFSGEDEGLSFGFEVLESEKTLASAEGSSSENVAAVESVASAEAAAESVEAAETTSAATETSSDAVGTRPVASAEVTENATDTAATAPAAKTKKVEPELGLMFDDEPEPPAGASGAAAPELAEVAVGTRLVASAEAAPAADVAAQAAEPVAPTAESTPEAPAVTLSESMLAAGLQAMESEEAAPTVSAEPQAETAGPTATPDAMAAFDTAPEPAATTAANEIFEAIKQENLAQFAVREEDQPQSYITQFTAMAQAKIKGEQDMSGVAVSSTARPDDAKPAAPSSSNDSLMNSLRSIRANLHGGQLRTMVDKFKAPQTIYDIQSTRTVDLRMTIGVNEKYLLTQELFGGNVKEYTEAVGRLNDAKDTDTATSVWQTLSRQRAWDEGSLAYATFYDLLKRRFPDMA